MKTSKWIKFLGGLDSLYTLLLVTFAGLVIWIFYEIKFIFDPIMVILTDVLPPLILGLILYYLLNPLVERLDKHLARTWTVSVIYCILLIILALISVEVVLAIQHQMKDFMQQLPEMIDSFQRKGQVVMAELPFSKELMKSAESIKISGSKINQYLEQYLQQGINSFGSFFSVISTILITVFTGPIIAFFLLKDKEHFFKYTKGLMPPTFRDDFQEIGKIADQQIGGYLKGQIVASLILGIIYLPLFMLINLRYSGLIALAAGIFSIIPYVGSFIAFLPGVVIAFQTSSWMVIKFILVWFIVQFLHGQFIVPRIMGDNLQLHPVTVLLVLLVMGDLLGVVGVIFGIPFYCLLKVIVIYLFRRFKRRYNRFFGDHGSYEETDFSKEKYLKK